MITSPSSDFHGVWKKFIDSAVLDDSYPQRIAASFQYLCPDWNSTFFTLKVSTKDFNNFDYNFEINCRI
jgi:hypothetical protein